jgi:hypothetical protein
MKDLLMQLAALVMSAAVSFGQMAPPTGGSGGIWGWMSGVVRPRGAGIPYLTNDLRAMWTFSQSNGKWTNEYYGRGVIVPVTGSVTYMGDGTVLSTGGTCYAISPATLYPSNTGTIAVRFYMTQKPDGSDQNWITYGGVNLSSDFIRLGVNQNSGITSVGLSTGSPMVDWNMIFTYDITTQWVTCVQTWTNDDARIYFKVDGNSRMYYGEDTQSKIEWSATQAFMWSENTNGTKAFKGKTDEVRFYGSVHTSNECELIMADMQIRR